jgi:hypothetical protein
MISFGRRLKTFLFPLRPRELPGRRLLKVTLRSAHVLTAAGLVGAHVFAVEAGRAEPWLWAALLSGALILMLDLHESAAVLLQVRGLVVIAKLAVLAALPHLGHRATWMLAAVVVLSVLSSHAPGRVRYFLVLGRSRITGADSKG